MPTLYKVYTMALAERLKEVMEEKEIIPRTQVGFRKGMETMENIYVINYVMNRQLGKKGGRLVVMFVDLKTAFDSVVRKVVIGMMKGKGIREELVERIEEVLRETKSRIRVGRKLRRSFWAARGVKQGCPLSPLLFNILLADLEEEMGKVKRRGVKIEGEKVFTLSYADDMEVMAEEEEELRGMIERIERYLDRKRLEVNVGKTKIIRFKKGRGRLVKREWRWKGKKIEEVKQYKYLGYVLQKNGRQDAHVKDRVRRAAAIMGQNGELEREGSGGIGVEEYDCSTDWCGRC